MGLTLAAVLTGCGHDPQPVEEKQYFRNARIVPGDYSKILLLEAGDDKTDRHVGYLNEGSLVGDEGRVERLSRVLDLSFSPVGYYFDDGTTYLTKDDGSDEKIGVFTINRSLEMLLEVEGTFSLKSQLK